MTGVDDVGTVFFERNRVLRGIWAEKVEQTQTLLASGLIQKLEQEGLFPKTEVAKDNLPGFGMTIEHERLHPLVLPSEWTPTMLRDAVLALLEVNRIARSFGYETKDAHLYNLTFRGTRPVYFDFGSFVRLDLPHQGWRAYNEFVHSVQYPIVLGRHRSPLLNHVLSDYFAERQIGHEDYIRLRLGWLARWLPCALLARAREVYFTLVSIGSWGDDRVNRSDRSAFARFLLNASRKTNVFRFLTADFSRLQNRIRRMSKHPLKSRDSDIQRPFLDKSGQTVPDARIRRICELVSALKVESLVELGGNRGMFSLALHRTGLVPKIVTTDCDEDAADDAYSMFKQQKVDCTAAILDFLEENRSIKVPSVTERYQADVVVALALTHHLILNQGVDVSLLLRRTAAFCKRHAVIEFMPLGLFDDQSASPAPPWYTVDWFRRHFVAQFELLHEEKLEENRIVFVGKKRDSL